MQEDEIIARTALGEDNNAEGWTAIIWTIKNRVRKQSWWGKTYTNVCLYPYQFSCWINDRVGHENFKRLLTEPIPDDLKAIVNQVVLGNEPDPTEGATHYHAATVQRPSSFVGLIHVGQFGGNIFYKE